MNTFQFMQELRDLGKRCKVKEKNITFGDRVNGIGRYDIVTAVFIVPHEKEAKKTELPAQDTKIESQTQKEEVK